MENKTTEKKKKKKEEKGDIQDLISKDKNGVSSFFGGKEVKVKNWEKLVSVHFCSCPCCREEPADALAEALCPWRPNQ